VNNDSKTRTTDAAGFLDGKELACIHCGLCLSSCPTYLETGNENESPRGRIYLMRALNEGRASLAGTAVEHIDNCIGCRACEAACPSGVEYGELLEKTRERINERYSQSLRERLLRRVLVERILPVPSRMNIAVAFARLLRRLRIDRLIDLPLSLLPDRDDAPPLPLRSPTGEAENRGEVGMFRGCVMDTLFRGANINTVRLLNRTGYDVSAPTSQVCCGALFAHGGNLAEARRLARLNIEAFEGMELDAIVVNAAGCGSTLKEYGRLLQDDPLWRERAEAFSRRVRDITEMMAPTATEPCEEPNGDLVTYQDACHLVHAQGVDREPRALIRNIVGGRFVELPESDICCGSGGSYNLTHPDMAGRLARRKVDAIVRTGAATVVTGNPGCLMQIRAALHRAGIHDIRVVHIADYLAESLLASSEPKLRLSSSERAPGNPR